MGSRSYRVVEPKRPQERTFENRHGSNRRHAPGERARQFKPFAALRGFEELVRDQELVDEPRREPTPEQAREMSERIAGLVRGEQVRVTAYDGHAYRTVTGAFVQVDEAARQVVLVCGRYDLSDIVEVEEPG